MGKEKKIRKSNKPMTAAALKEWRERMGYNRADAIRNLGCTRDEWTEWTAGETEIPRHIGLACAALALGMQPYGEEQT